MQSQTVSSDDFEILAVVALRLLGDGGRAAELAEGFSRLRLPGTPDESEAMLAYLSHLGLVQVLDVSEDEPHYVPTALGQHYAETLPGGSHLISNGLEELERLRTEFMSTIAHELRTPLTAMRMSIGLLLEPTAEPDPVIRTQLLKNVARSADRMQQLIADLLDLTRFQAGYDGLQLRWFDGCALTIDASDAIAPLMAARNQVLNFDVPGGPTWVYADRRRIEQVLLNLLSNAQKYSPDGAQIRLSFQENENMAKWSVSDQGPGISLEDQAHLFERYFTGMSNTDERKAGAGLGLPIALAIAQAHGGTILVDSVVGHGSTFTLSIPNHAGPEAEEE